MAESKHVTYEDAGVDTAEGGRAVDAIKQMVAETNARGHWRYRRLWRPILRRGAQGHGGSDPHLRHGRRGHQARARQILDRHETVGQDLVAMCVNDILASGAEPLFFLDYVAIGHIEAEHMAKIVKGVADGCKLAGCALVGGEMAEHPASCVRTTTTRWLHRRVVDRPKMIDPANVREGDVIIGLPSTGVHSNGYSLVRKVIGVDGIVPGTPEGRGQEG